MLRQGSSGILTRRWLSSSKVLLPHIPPKAARELGATWDAENLVFFTHQHTLSKFADFLPPPRNPTGRYSDTKTKLFVPFEDKAKVRAKFAKFDPDTRAWYAPAGLDLTEFAEWSVDKPVYLHVPFHENDEAKACPGVSFDMETRQWFTLISNHEAIERWGNKNTNKYYLTVPFKDKDEVKRLGARFDWEAKKYWFDAKKLSKHLFAKWIDEDDEGRCFCYLQVPFCDNDEVKQLGAKFDRECKLWYFDQAALPRSDFAKWPIAATVPLVEAKQKRYLRVPFAEKDEVKQLGARFDGTMKHWYFEESSFLPATVFAKWCVVEPIAEPVQGKVKPHYLHVPFTEKDEAKALGAKFDSTVKQWYFDENLNARAVFAKWQSIAAENQAPFMAAVVEKRCYLRVPFASNAEVKRLGARFDCNAKQWYFDETKFERSLFSKWIPVFPAQQEEKPPQQQQHQEITLSQAPLPLTPLVHERVILHVPFAESDEARELGALFCQTTKKWYVDPKLDLQTAKARFSKWLSRRKFLAAPKATNGDQPAVALKTMIAGQ